MANIFDEVLYPGFPFPETHPDRLATQATLFGLTPPPVETCRVLELGCGDGANLIPMAFGLPEGRFTGIDLAARPIANGRTMIAALGLTNITLVEMNILSVSRDIGEFDYIVAHGVYSWVPPEVQDRVLRICSENLAPNGVAYVSYNAYPGGHYREMLRRMMLYETRTVADPLARVGQGLALLRGLAESLKDSDPRKHILVRELDRMKKVRPASLVHDDFAEYNSPVYFYEFTERAAAQRLAFLAEAEITPMTLSSPIAEDQGAAPDAHDRIRREQLFDFQMFREFRRTLLCHDGMRPAADPMPERLRSLFISSAARPDSPEVDVRSSKTETFTMEDRDVGASTNHPPSKAALQYLSKLWPGRISFEALKSSVLAEVEGCEGCSSPPLDEVLLKMYAGKLVELHAYAPRVAISAGARPLASPLARYQLRDSDVATNLQHRSVQFDEMTRHLALLTDGTRDRTSILAELDRMLKSGLVSVEENGRVVDDPARARELLQRGVDGNMEKLLRLGLLMA